MTKSEFLASLPWIVAAIGIVVAHLLSEARERRKEVRAQTDKLIERLAALEIRGTNFHTGASFDAVEARGIEVEISSIERRAGRLVGAAVAGLADEIIVHRQSLTLRNFEKSKFISQDASSAICQEIAATTAAYEEALEAAYHSQYPPRFPYYRVAGGRLNDVFGTLVALWAGLLVGATLTFLAMQP